MFNSDVVVRLSRRPISDEKKILIGRAFILAIVAITYGLAMWLKNSEHVFDLGVWCFSGFAALFPIAVAAVYWRRSTSTGVCAAIGVTTLSWLALFYRDMIAEKPPGVEELLIFGMMPVAVMFVLSATTLVIVSLLTRPPSQTTLARFFPEQKGV
jgi:SSS family solute:Na+ symporter